MRRSLNFYKTEKGNCPTAEFLDGLPSKVAQKVTWVLKLIQELDAVPRQYFKKLSDTEGIWECRIDFGGNTYRMLAFFHGSGRIILTHGFMKKTMKTPEQEIKRAQELKADYLRRHGNA